ncbi:MAG: glycine cleavage system protein H [Candidatus Hodarchaeales archaeon]
MKILDYNYPDDRKYLIDSTPSHLWFLKDEEPDIYFLGVTDFFQNQIGEISQITLKKKDNTIPKGKTVGLIQAKNYSAILKSPIEFKIVETNDKLIKKPKTINNDPYSAGWIYKIQLNGEEDLNGDKLVSTEDSRLKTYIEYEKKNNALLADDCCPDFIGKSGAVRRIKPKKGEDAKEGKKSEKDKQKTIDNQKKK